MYIHFTFDDDTYTYVIVDNRIEHLVQDFRLINGTPTSLFLFLPIDRHRVYYSVLYWICELPWKRVILWLWVREFIHWTKYRSKFTPENVSEITRLYYSCSVPHRNEVLCSSRAMGMLLCLRSCWGIHHFQWAVITLEQGACVKHTGTTQPVLYCCHTR